ncbi:tetratricopeptide repeat protein [Opitutus sp. ER46]|uniref:tetratricopeptide repeat protein n=1 Tax=Opitutus sp. ER46 TaxID=2161864 RepID=UPI000D31E911|nr:tetratricopeptide repeat protein [Opitutus sp. ER46]PTY00697.1 hypothetical protein DB354_01175 [Opitutus sp. ER46]
MLVLAAMLAYANTFHAPFVFDDVSSIADNPTIRDLRHWRDVLFPVAGFGVTISGRPVLNLSLALCHALSGQAVWSYHAFNLLVHVLAGLTAFGVVRRTLLLVPGTTPLDARRRADATGLGFAVALLWTVHPLQTESVTYIIQRTESLMGLCVLLTLYGFIRGATSPHPARWHALAVAACLAGVGTKEVAAVAPLLVLLYDRTFLAGTFAAAWRQRRAVHLSLLATWLPLALLVGSTGWNRGGTAGFNVGLAPWAYWGTQFEAIARYLQLALWPHPLVFEYGTFWADLPTAAAFALLIVPLVALTVVALRRWPRAGFLGAWFFLVLAPTSLMPGTLQMIVEHRMYLPLLSVLAGGVVGLHALCSRRAPARLARFGPLAACGVAVPLGLLTHARNAVYADDLTLWRTTVAQRPGSAIAQGGLGTAWFQRGEFRAALTHYERALQLAPGRAGSHYHLALTHAALGNPAAAAEHNEAALRINPLFYPAHYQLGLALTQLGRTDEAIAHLAEAARLQPAQAETQYAWAGALAQAGRWSDAVTRYEEALRLRPGWATVENDLGSALLRLDRVADALACFTRALEHEPGLTEARLNQGLAQARRGDASAALATYAEAVRLAPAHARARLQLGIALGRSGRVAEAVPQLQEAVRLAPASAEPPFNLGIALAQLGRLPEAVDAYAAVIALQPGHAPAHTNLAIVLLQLRRPAEAREHLAAALRAAPDYPPARALAERLGLVRR